MTNVVVGTYQGSCTPPLPVHRLLHSGLLHMVRDTPALNKVRRGWVGRQGGGGGQGEGRGDGRGAFHGAGQTSASQMQAFCDLQ